ncbi:TPA: O-antigen polymerase, partial [Klebsiella pneumoniae]
INMTSLISYNISEINEIGIDKLNYSLSIIHIVICILVVLSFFFGNVDGEYYQVCQSEIVGDVVYKTMALAIILFVTFFWGIKLADLENTGQVAEQNFFKIISFNLTLVFFQVSLISVLSFSTLSKYNKFISLLLFVATIFLVVFSGRRYVLYSLLLAVISIGLNGNIRKKVKPIHLIFGVFVLFISQYIFISLRFYLWQSSINDVDVFDLFLSVFDVLMNQTDDVSQYLSQNYSSRGMVINFFAELIDVLDSNVLLFSKGTILFSSIIVSIPKVLLPIDKEPFLSLAYEEHVAAMLQGRTDYEDLANTLLTAGFVDFSYFGVILYPVFFSFLYIFILRVGKGFLSLVNMYILFSYIIFSVLYFEKGLAGYFTSIIIAFVTIAIFSTAKAFLYSARQE